MTSYTKSDRLLTTANAKTVKGEKLGYKTHILYLAPHTQNSKGINLCPGSTKECQSACLYNSGRGGFTRVQESRLNKTEYFIQDRPSFLKQLNKEITEIQEKASNYIPVIRLNGTSDIAWEKYKIQDDKNIFELNPDVQFYDYTKLINRVRDNGYSNYHLLYSRDGSNEAEALKLLDKKYNITVVFGVKRGQDFPDSYKGYPIIDGDQNDLRFLDTEGKIVGLRYKYMTYEGARQDNIDNLNNNSFIVSV